VKIALISDIHGNHYALDAVLATFQLNNIKKIMVLGDLVGYYYHPEKIFESLDKWDYEIISGNHERILKGLIDKEIEPEFIRLRYGSGHKFALNNLSQSQIEKLINAPVSMKQTINNIRVNFCHGSPFDPDFYIYPDAKPDVLNMCDDNLTDMVFIGHSHYPFIYKSSNTLLVNIGSVGQLRSKGGDASWGILNTENGTVELKITRYDVRPLLEEVKLIDPDITYLSEILKRNNLC
jgi:putative phosphoesterase